MIQCSKREALLERVRETIGIPDGNDPILEIVIDAVYHAEIGVSEEDWKNAAFNGIYSAIDLLKQAASIITTEEG